MEKWISRLFILFALTLDYTAVFSLTIYFNLEYSFPIALAIFAGLLAGLLVSDFTKAFFYVAAGIIFGFSLTLLIYISPFLSESLLLIELSLQEAIGNIGPLIIMNLISAEIGALVGVLLGEYFGLK